MPDSCLETLAQVRIYREVRDWSSNNRTDDHRKRGHVDRNRANLALGSTPLAVFHSWAQNIVKKRYVSLAYYSRRSFSPYACVRIGPVDAACTLVFISLWTKRIVPWNHEMSMLSSSCSHHAFWKTKLPLSGSVALSLWCWVCSCDSWRAETAVDLSRVNPRTNICFQLSHEFWKVQRNGMR